MITKTDVENVAISINRTLTNKQIDEVLELYPSEQENDPTATWNLVVEHCINQVDTGEQPYCINDFIKELQRISENKRKLPLVITCPNGLQVKPTVKIQWKDDNIFAEGNEVVRMVICY